MGSNRLSDVYRCRMDVLRRDAADLARAMVALSDLAVAARTEPRYPLARPQTRRAAA